MYTCTVKHDITGYNTNFYNRYTDRGYLFGSDGKREKDYSFVSGMKV
jgi:hypothetical protein